MPFNPGRTKILAIVAENENGVLQGVSSGMGVVFARMGYQQTIIDMYQPSGAGRLKAALSAGDVAFAYGFAGTGSRLSFMDGANIWTAARVPFVSLWYDHPCYNYRQHLVDSPYVINGYHVADHIEARIKYLPPSSSRSILLPVMGEPFLFSREQPLAQCPHAIVFAKTSYQPSMLCVDWLRHPAWLQTVLWELVSQAQKDRNIDLAGAAASLFALHGQDQNDLDIFFGVVQEVDNYVRAWRSDLLARALLPFPAHIIGRGWDYLKHERGIAEFHDPLSFDQYVHHMAKFKIFANSNPVWRDGIHERSFMALSIGRVLLTDRTIKTDQYFEGLSNYVGFEWGESISDAVSRALSAAEQDDSDYINAAGRALQKNGVHSYLEYMTTIEQQVKDLLDQLAA